MKCVRWDSDIVRAPYDTHSSDLECFYVNGIAGVIEELTRSLE